MPQLIEHIDAIARQKGRDVLYVEFHEPERSGETKTRLDRVSEVNWEHLLIRQQLIEWLQKHDIEWEPCGHFANPCLMLGYCGQIYIELPFDRSLPAYQALEAFLENPDGTMRHAEATFWCCQLERAMKNSAHDEPGFWDRVGENF